MKRKVFLLLTGIIILSLTIGVVGCERSADDIGENGNGEEKIVVYISKTPYVHAWVATYIIKNIAEELDYKTDLVEADLGFMYQGMSQGDVDVYADVWYPTLHKSYLDRYEGEFEIAGTLYENAELGWTVPSYVDIDSIDELKGREDEFKGRVVGYEPSSGMMIVSEDVIKEYELDDYELVEGSVPAMLAEVDRAIKNKESIVFTAWRPHSMWVKYDLKILEDPKEIWEIDDVKTGVSNNLKEKAPDFYDFLHNFSIPIDDVEKMTVRVEDEDMDIDILAREWIEENRVLVDEMLGK